MTYDPVYMAAWRERNPEKLRAYRERWNAAHPGRAAELGRQGYAVNKTKRQSQARENYAASQKHFVDKMRDRVAKDPALYLWKRARDRAEKRGVEFNISPTDILVPIFCPVLGIRLERGRGRFNPTSPTLDRIDNDCGYVKGNIVVVSWRANRLKSDASLSEMRAILEFYEALSLTEQRQHELSQAKQHLLAAERLDAVIRAKDDLMTFMQLMMPDPEAPEDAHRSQYKLTPQGRLLCELMQKIERREIKRAAISIGPQTGKSTILTRGGPAWLAGRNPNIKLMVGAYNQTFAEEFGGDVRTLMQSSAYKQVFPNTVLKTGGTAKDLLETTLGAKMAFVGVGGSGTGKPAEIFIVDDPIRSDEDAQSEVYRERVWNWFTKVVNSRVRANSAIIVVHTRWSEDDLIGRLCDPDHPERNKKYAGIAERWTHLNIPTFITEEPLAKALGLKLERPTDPYIIKTFGDRPMTSLWPEEFPLDMLADQKVLDARAFAALRQGRPTPEDGEFFKESHIVPYHSLGELPKELRMYGASDHAVSTKQSADNTVIGCVGIDQAGDVWIMPDLVMRKMETDVIVDELLLQFQIHKPQLWWMESELISKSFGPFLKKLMMEKNIYTTLDPVTVSKDKSTRARAIQGRMSHRRVHFPVFAPWWPDAKNQLLKFPHGTHDDFVDWLAHIGMGLLKEIPASKQHVPERVVAVGSASWILAQTRLKARKEATTKATAGW